MKDAFQGPALRSSGFARAPSPEGFGPLWRSYRSEGEPCRGWFHFLSPEEALWSISIHDFVMDGDMEEITNALIAEHQAELLAAMGE